MLVNKVAQSGLITIDLENYLPKQEIVALDISQFLFRGLILKEKEFRSALKAFDWSGFEDKIVAINCSTDAIVPNWAYMLVTQYLINVASSVEFGSITSVEENSLVQSLKSINIEEYSGQKVILKGCGKLAKSGKVYVEASKLLLPVVQSLMFGEACSTVPIYKRKKIIDRK